MQEEKIELFAELSALLEQRRLTVLRHRLAELLPQDIAELFPDFKSEEKLLVYRLLPKEIAAEVLVEMPPEERVALIADFSDYELRRVLDELYSDDTVELLEEMPANFVKRILKNCSAEQRRAVNALLYRFPDKLCYLFAVILAGNDRSDPPLTDADIFGNHIAKPCPKHPQGGIFKYFRVADNHICALCIDRDL